MSDSADRPLVTFALFAYNQERFIREAVEGALAQVYEPLQIILSDDCSTDGTFEIIQEMARSYSGPHRLVLNRNERNLGVGGHVNQLVALAEGELIIGAAGDDISLPERTKELVGAWIKGGKKATSIYSGLTLIDGNGIELGVQSKYLQDLNDLVKSSYIQSAPYGAVHAFSRALMLRFGRLDSAVTYEDQVIGYRSALSGEFEYVNKSLVKYRIHADAICSGLNDARAQSPDQLRANFLRNFRCAIACRTQNMKDAKEVLQYNHPILDILRKQIVENHFREIVYANSFDMPVILAAMRNAHNGGARLTTLLKDVCKIAAWPIYARYYDLRRRMIIRRERKLGGI